MQFFKKIKTNVIFSGMWSVYEQLTWKHLDDKLKCFRCAQDDSNICRTYLPPDIFVCTLDFISTIVASVNIEKQFR